MRRGTEWWILIVLYALVGLGMAMFLLMIRDAEQLNRVEAVSMARGELIEVQAEYIDLLERALEARWTRDVTVTAYTARVEECDTDPTRTANMTKPRPGIVAVSRDLFLDGWTFGKKVYLAGVGVFEIADLMNERHEARIDVFMGDTGEALEFGVRPARAALMSIN